MEQLLESETALVSMQRNGADDILPYLVKKLPDNPRKVEVEEEELSATIRPEIPILPAFGPQTVNVAEDSDVVAQFSQEYSSSNRATINTPLSTNLRKNPQVSAEVIVMLMPDEEVALLGNSKNVDGIVWQEIEAGDDKRGWILDAFLRPIQPLEDIENLMVYE